MARVHPGLQDGLVVPVTLLVSRHCHHTSRLSELESAASARWSSLVNCEWGGMEPSRTGNADLHFIPYFPLLCYVKEAGIQTPVCCSVILLCLNL